MATISSPPSTLAEVFTEPTEWWLKCPVDPALNQRITVSMWNPTKAKRRARFEPVGQTRAVILRGPTLGVDATLSLRTLNSVQHAAVEALVDSGATLLLQNVIGQQWYVEVSGDIPEQFRLSYPDEAYPVLHFYEWQIPLTEVALPA
jgi:hypothetical protein